MVTNSFALGTYILILEPRGEFPNIVASFSRLVEQMSNYTLLSFWLTF